jgi:hypothetical protein
MTGCFVQRTQSPELRTCDNKKIVNVSANISPRKRQLTTTNAKRGSFESGKENNGINSLLQNVAL